MQKTVLPAIGFLFAFFIVTSSEAPVYAQQPATNPDDFMKGEDFTRILKDEWSYLKDATDEYLASTGKKTEFETTNEYNGRVARTKAAYVEKINKHIQEKKFDKRVFGVLFKASLASYDADKQQYRIRSSETVEAPYNIPTLFCTIPRNLFVVLTDSINRGFRTSAIQIAFPKDYRWTVPRDDARAAKNEEGNIYFQVHFVLDFRQDDFEKKAKMRIVPTGIEMLNLSTHKVYWSQDIK